MQNESIIKVTFIKIICIYSTELQVFLVLFLASIVGGSPGTTLSIGGETLFRSWVAVNPFLHTDISVPLCGYQCANE